MTTKTITDIENRIKNEIKKWGTGSFEEVEDDDYTHTRMAEFVKIPIETLEWILNKEQTSKNGDEK
ncbi:MAG: hypothetical protein PHS54_02990 [Clostridia bacterium]|nr:hypothetical protein [Clostridia bacterium]